MRRGACRGWESSKSVLRHPSFSPTWKNQQRQAPSLYLPQVTCDFGCVARPLPFCCSCLVAKTCVPLLQPHELQTATVLCPWNFPGKNAGVGCHSLLQGNFPTQGLNPCLLHRQVDSLPLSHQGSHPPPPPPLLTLGGL